MERLEGVKKAIIDVLKETYQMGVSDGKSHIEAFEDGIEADANEILTGILKGIAADLAELARYREAEKNGELVRVVRRKDCKQNMGAICRLLRTHVIGEDYCSDGKPKEAQNAPEGAALKEKPINYMDIKDVNDMEKFIRQRRAYER